MSKKIVLSVNTDSTNEYEKLRLENLRKVDLWITAFSPVEEMAKTLKKKPVFYTFIWQFQNFLIEIRDALEDKYSDYPCRYCVTINQLDTMQFTFEITMETVGNETLNYSYLNYRYSANIDLYVVLTDGVLDEVALSKLLIFYKAILMISNDNVSVSTTD